MGSCNPASPSSGAYPVSTLTLFCRDIGWNCVLSIEMGGLECAKTFAETNSPLRTNWKRLSTFLKASLMYQRYWVSISNGFVLPSPTSTVSSCARHLAQAGAPMRDRDVRLRPPGLVRRIERERHAAGRRLIN